MQDFRELKTWQKSHELTRAVYRVTGRFPSAETYGVTGQMRRAAVSVGANIAEGCGRGSRADFARFLNMAMGSASELQYLLLLARDLAYLPQDVHAELDGATSEIKRMLTSLLKKLRAAKRQPTDSA